MENNYTIKKFRQGEWLVLDEDGDRFAILERFATLESEGTTLWRAFGWEDGDRLYIGEETTYVAPKSMLPLEVAQKISY